MSAFYNWQANVKRWQSMFDQGIRKVLSQVHADLTMTDAAVEYLDQYMYSLLAHICVTQGRAPSTQADCQTCVEAVLPPDLANWALKDAQKAVDVFNQTKKKSSIRTEFPVEKVHTKMLKEVYSPDESTPTLPVILYLVTVLDYLAADILQLAGNYATNRQTTVIDAEEVRIPIEADPALRNLFNALRYIPDNASGPSMFNYDEAVREMLLAEQDFLSAMELLIHVFQDGVEAVFPDDAIVLLFSGLSEVRDFSFNLIVAIEDALDKGRRIPYIGDILQDLALNQEYQVLLDYVDSLSPSLARLDQLLAEKDVLAAFQAQDERWVNAARFELPELLRRPVRHLLHHVASAEVLLKAAMANRVRKREIDRLRTVLEHLKPATREITHANYSFVPEQSSYLQFPTVLRHQAMAEASSIAGLIDGWDFNTRGPVSRLLHKGHLCLIDARTRHRQVFLFDSFALTCKENAQGKTVLYRFKEQFRLGQGQVTDVSGTNRIEFATETGDKVVFEADSEEDQALWLKAFTHKANTRFLEEKRQASSLDFNKRMSSLLPSQEVYPFVAPDNENCIVFEDDPSSRTPVVKAATLIKLVERLTYPQYADTQLLRHFLTTYRSFCDPTELLDVLLKRYNIPLSDTVKQNKTFEREFIKRYCTPVRLRVVNVLKQWVEKHFYDFRASQGAKQHVTAQSSNLLKMLLSFTKEVVRQDKKMAHACQPIIKAVKKQVKGDQSAPVVAQLPPSETYEMYFLEVGSAPMHLLTLHPREIARQMTIIESHLYRKVRPSELVGQMWTKEKKWLYAPNVLNMTHCFNRMNRWFIRCIVETSDLAERVDLIEMLIETLRELRELNNFNGMLEIISALHSSAIHRLKHTWAEVNAKRMKLFESYQEIFGGNNYAALRNEMAAANPPLIPFFGMYLTDITFIEDGSPDNLTVKDTELINFGKRRMVAKTTCQIQEYQDQPYQLVEVGEVQDFLLEAPSLVSDPIPFPDSDATAKDISKFEDAVYSLSLKLEPRGGDKADLPQGTPLITDTVAIATRRDLLSAHSKTRFGSKSSVRTRTSSVASSVDSDRRSSLSNLSFSPAVRAAAASVAPQSPGSPISPALPPRAAKPFHLVENIQEEA
eukprot:TRINITY_DN11358_c0_g1_i1.p1 TRINITY_DN11358_c0_g1~~TRINITY_DN11358_c0_g1_i1.p1  ORF type:complete len:1117 (+),score=242.00 TRINITY_DN11358_c0_g1_i1:57-3407(+)